MTASPVTLVRIAICIVMVLGVSVVFADAPPSNPAGVEFFEKHIRPLLAERCYQCHSAKAEKLKGNLHLDLPAGILVGGDNGPAVVPGDPEKSRLVQAVRYTNVDLQMPPKGKLPDAAIADLEQWVRIGAPIPAGSAAPVAATRTFDLAARKASHWSWQPIKDPPVPMKDAAWPLGDIDRFILAKLAERRLAPAPDADRRTLIRRATFDLIGLPPKPDDVDAFVRDPAPDDVAFAKVVDRLLASEHFGERWARHWLDLVRYAETYGHEFDYPIKNAEQYPLYVVRALNADVPYDQFVTEHLAGDLLENPRVNPKEGFNESILGTGFWFFGDQVHAPVDVRQHQSDRIDNQLDVFGKTFLGLTLACARCHDHKFDAIATKDYYALFAVAEATYPQQAMLDPGGKIASVVGEMRRAVEPVNLLCGAGSQPAANAEGRLNARTTSWSFDADTFSPWAAAGQAFGPGPTKHGEWDSLSRAPRAVRPGVAHSGLLSPKLRGILRSPSFVIEQPFVSYLLSGKNARLRLIVDGYTMDEFQSLLFSGMIVEVNTGGQWRWHNQNATRYVGHRAHIELIDDSAEGWIAVDEIRFGDKPVSEPIPDDRPEVPGLRDSEILLAATAQLDRLTREIPEPMRAITALDGTGADGRVFIRGSSKNAGEAVPRRFIEALSGTAHPFPDGTSGRLELARAVTDRSNPLTARVMVNRIWHHLLGKGIVPTVDDFGVMGEPPTHPELLDHLATRFVRDGWSVKKLIRSIVLSRTYQLSTHGSDVAAQIDPKNELLQHARIRRLEAESIRDAILFVSGRLDDRVGGPFVDVHLTPFMEGRGKPADGPLDGDGMRSLYLRVRRNFLSPMMLTFDAPIPFSTMGRRSVSNVPAQALILLNDPFVSGEAKRWATKTLEPGKWPAEMRIVRMYEEAYSRRPTEQEVAEAIAFLKKQGTEYGLSETQSLADVRPWTDLAHVLLNVKEFIFLD